MSSILFQAQNQSQNRKSSRVTVHPYIYSRTSLTVTIGVYCDEPAPVDADAVVIFTHPDLSFPQEVYVPIRKGMLDSGIRTTKPLLQPIPVTTMRFYRYAEPYIDAFEINGVEVDYFEAGEKGLCPTMTFNLTLRAALAPGEILLDKYINPFHFGYINLDPVDELSNSELDILSPLAGSMTSNSYVKSVEINRAEVLQSAPSVLSVLVSYSPATDLSSFYATPRCILKADTNGEVLFDDYGPGIYEKSRLLRMQFGNPQFGNYIHAGVSIFDVEIAVVDIVTYF